MCFGRLKHFNYSGRKIFIKKRDEREKNINNQEDGYENAIRLYMVIYFFYGFMLLFFGKEVESFFKSMNELQIYGSFFIILGLFVYTLMLTVIEKSSTTFLRVSYFVMSIILCISALLIVKTIKIPTNLESYFGTLLFFTIFLLSGKLTTNLIFIIKKINKSIEEPAEKVTILVGFFGVLISLLNVLK